MTRMAGEEMPAAVVEGRPMTLAQIEAAYRSGDHLVDGGEKVGLFWASSIQEKNAPRPIEHAIELLKSLPAEAEFYPPPGSDPRDYKVEPGLWRSQILPRGVSISQAIKDGVW